MLGKSRLVVVLYLRCKQSVVSHKGEYNEDFAESLTCKLPILTEFRNAKSLKTFNESLECSADGLSLKSVRKPVTIYIIFGKKDEVTVI